MHFNHSIKVSAEQRGEKISLYLRVNIEGTRRKFSLSYTLRAGEFDRKLQRVVNREDADRINEEMAFWLSSARKVLSRYELVDQRIPAMDEFANDFLIAVGKRKEKVESDFFVDRIDDFEDEQSRMNNWTHGTSEKFVALKNRWKGFEKEKGKHYRFDDVTDDLLNAFMEHEISTGHRNTTLQKTAAFLRWYLRWAHSKRIYEGKSHDTFRPHFKGGNGEYKDIIYLEKEELTALVSLEIPPKKQYLERVRDVFVFACFCGLRYSDVAALRREHIHDGVIEVVTKKTSDRLRIDLNDITRKILDKYKDEPHVLPVISNQKTNDYLKELCRLAGITQPISVIYYIGSERKENVIEKCELITFHAARRTFITQALRLGMPVEVIMKFSGHHSHEMLKPYMKVVDELKKREMNKFNDFFK